MAGELSPVIRNQTYVNRGGRPQQLDVYAPGGPAPASGRPVIIAIHGGGWRRLDKRDYGFRIASAFVRHGYVVVAPNYALSAPGRSTWPLNLQDVQAAVRWVKRRSVQLGIDPQRIVAMGESAGGHLASLVGTAGSSNQMISGVTATVAAVVGFSSPTDLAALYRQSPGAGTAVAQYLGGTPSAVATRYVAASPVKQVQAGDPPTLLIHGVNDPLVPVSQSEALVSRLGSVGIRTQLIRLPGLGHDLDFPIHTPRNLLSQILEFLKATWKDKKSQSLIH